VKFWPTWLGLLAGLAALATGLFAGADLQEAGSWPHGIPPEPLFRSSSSPSSPRRCCDCTDAPGPWRCCVTAGGGALGSRAASSSTSWRYSLTLAEGPVPACWRLRSRRVGLRCPAGDGPDVDGRSASSSGSLVESAASRWHVGFLLHLRPEPVCGRTFGADDAEVQSTDRSLHAGRSCRRRAEIRGVAAEPAKRLHHVLAA